MKSPVHIRKSHLWLLIMVAVLGIAFVGYGQYYSWQTEQKFANLEQDIDALKTELEKQGIKDISKNKYCLRDGEKFGGGQLRCEINLGFAGEKSTVINLLNSTNFSTISSVENSRIEFQHNKNKNTCFMNVDNLKDQVSSIEFYCIDAVNKPVYPIIE